MLVSGNKMRLFDRVFETLASAEFWYLGCRYAHFLAGTGVPGIAGCAGLDYKYAKSGHAYLLSFGQGRDNRIEYGVDSILCGLFGAAELVEHCL